MASAIFIIATMVARRQIKTRHAILLLIAVVAVLLVALVAQPLDHSGMALACLALLPLVLFETVESQDRSWWFAAGDDAALRSNSYQPDLYQRPPPLLLA